MKDALPTVILQLIISKVQFSIGGGKRKFTALKPDEYRVLVQLLRNQFDVPVAERSALQRAAVRKFYRNRERLGLAGSPPKLYMGE